MGVALVCTVSWLNEDVSLVCTGLRLNEDCSLVCTGLWLNDMYMIMGNVGMYSIMVE